MDTVWFLLALLILAVLAADILVHYWPRQRVVRWGGERYKTMDNYDILEALRRAEARKVRSL